MAGTNLACAPTRREEAVGWGQVRTAMSLCYVATLFPYAISIGYVPTLCSYASATHCAVLTAYAHTRAGRAAAGREGEGGEGGGRAREESEGVGGGRDGRRERGRERALARAPWDRSPDCRGRGCADPGQPLTRYPMPPNAPLLNVPFWAVHLSTAPLPHAPSVEGVSQTERPVRPL
eukprot:1193863-Rhodomonas_salina.1